MTSFTQNITNRKFSDRDLKFQARGPFKSQPKLLKDGLWLVRFDHAFRSEPFPFFLSMVDLHSSGVSANN
jgi:hypothetical protein